MFYLDFTFGCGYPVALRVEQSTDLGEIAVSLDGVVQHGGLHEKSVVAFEHSLDALLVAVDEHGRFFAVHEAPHLLVDADFWVLRTQLLLIS